MTDDDLRTPVCTKDPIEDLGEGVRIERRYFDGELHGIAWWHPCTRDPSREDFMGTKPAWSDGWTVEKVNPLTLSPSILCGICGFHGHIQEGRWVPA